jgi:hypothetical protein
MVKSLKPDDKIPVEDKEKVIKFILKNCSEFLSICKKSRKLLYRGSKKSPKSFIGLPRQDRRSIEGNYSTQAMIQGDIFLKASGIKALRSESIFCNSDFYEAKNYGTLYMIFPLNGFNFAYSKIHTCRPMLHYDFPTLSIFNKIQKEYLSIRERLYELIGYAEKIKNVTLRHKLRNIYSTMNLRNFDVDFLNFKTAETTIHYILADIQNIIKIYPKFKLFTDEMKNINDMLTVIKSKKLDKESVNFFIKENQITDKNLSWALSKNQDVWISGPYVAVNSEYFSYFRKLINEKYSDPDDGGS